MDAALDIRFGRCSNFVLFNTDSGECSSVENTAKNAAGGAGSSAVQLLLNNKAEVVVAPDAGPQAMSALDAMKIPVYRQDECKTAAEALEAYKSGSLEQQFKASVSGMHKA